MRLTRYRERDDGRANFSAFNNQLRPVDPASVDEYTIALDNDPEAEDGNNNDSTCFISVSSLWEGRQVAHKTPGSRTAESASFLLVVALSLRMMTMGMTKRIRSLRMEMLELAA